MQTIHTPNLIDEVGHWYCVKYHDGGVYSYGFYAAMHNFAHTKDGGCITAHWFFSHSKPYLGEALICYEIIGGIVFNDIVWIVGNLTRTEVWGSMDNMIPF